MMRMYGSTPVSHTMYVRIEKGLQPYGATLSGIGIIARGGTALGRYCHWDKQQIGSSTQLPTLLATLPAGKCYSAPVAEQRKLLFHISNSLNIGGRKSTSCPSTQPNIDERNNMVQLYWKYSQTVYWSNKYYTRSRPILQ